MEEQEEAAPASLGSGLSFVPGLVAIGSFCGHEEAEPACTRTLGVVGLVWVQDVWHLVVDARIPWDQHLTLLNVHTHPACAGLEVGTASAEQR